MRRLLPYLLAFFALFACSDPDIIEPKPDDNSPIAGGNIREPGEPREPREPEEENFWKGKVILWLGTSIPEGGGPKSYPVYVAEKLEATVYNESSGGSTARAFLYHGTCKGMSWLAASRALSHTIAEKESLIEHYYSGLDENGNIAAGGVYGWKDLCDSAPEELTEADKERMLSCSYENKLIHKYLDRSHSDFIVRPDVIVIDHGYNDLSHGHYDNYTRSEAIAVPADVNDRRRYIGAVNFIVNTIREYYPDQKIIFIGHFENEFVPVVHLGQLNLFDYWKDEYPAFKLWEVLGWTQDINPETGLTYLQTNCPDNLHPHKDERIDEETGYRVAIKQIGEACYNYFVDLYSEEE